jgi:hypothetical protein
MTPGQWDALPWPLQETYLTGLAQDPEVPFSREVTAGGEGGGEAGPAVRKAETGAEVFDLRGMIAGLESNPAARKRS